MIAKNKRITTKEFKCCFNKGEKKFTSHFRIVLVEKKDLPCSRFATIVSKKIIKSAVGRNQGRRKIYTMISDIYPQIRKDQLVFIFVQRDIRTIPNCVLKKELMDVLLSK